MAEWVWMHNAATGGTQRFAVDAVDAWRDMGWEPCDPPAAPNSALDPNHPALAPAPPGVPAETPQTTGADRRPAKQSTAGRAPASDKEE